MGIDPHKKGGGPDRDPKGQEGGRVLGREQQAPPIR